MTIYTVQIKKLYILLHLEKKMNKFNQEVKNRIDEYNKNTIEDFMLF